MAEGIPVYNAQGRVCGNVVDGKLKKNVKAQHQLQQPPGWAWDKAILLRARQYGATVTELHDLDTGTTYTAPLSEFDQHGVEINRGFGLQVVLPLQYWKTHRKGQTHNTQLPLF